MDDLVFPDNPKREARVYELANDIKILMNDLANDADEIKSLLEKLDKLIRSLYEDIQAPIPHDAVQEFEWHGWVVPVFRGLAGLISTPLASAALKKAAVLSLRRAGRIGEAVFYDAMGIGLNRLTWIKIGVGASAFAFVIALEFGIGAITGAIKRGKLQECIHSSIQPRIELKKAAIINGKIKDKLNAVIDSCEMMKKLGYTKEQIDKAQEIIADKFEEEVSEITDQTAKAELADLDKYRGSWTNED